MVRDTRSRSRKELSEHVDRNEDELRDRETDVEQICADQDLLQDLQGGELDLSGFSSDGVDEVTAAVEAADSAADEERAERDRNLDGAQEEHELFLGEMSESQETSEKDLGRISDVSAPAQTREMIDALREVKESALRDIEALEQIIERGREIKDRSDRFQDGQHDRRKE